MTTPSIKISEIELVAARLSNAMERCAEAMNGFIAACNEASQRITAERDRDKAAHRRRHLDARDYVRRAGE